MDRAEKCFFCERTSPETDLVAWIMQDERRMTHSACWLDAHRSGRLALTAAPESNWPRKTLDDIRRELETEYQTAVAGAETRVLAGVDGDAAAIEPRRADDAAAIERHAATRGTRERRRRYVMPVALGAGALALLLVGSHVAVTRERVPPTAAASGPAGAANREPRAVHAVAPVLPAAVTELDREVKALRRDLQALADRLERSDSRVGGVESRMRGVEVSMRAVESSMKRPDDVATSAAAARAVVRPRQTARTAAAPVTPAAAPTTTSDSEPSVPRRHPAPETPPVAHDVQPVEKAVVAAEARPASPTTTEAAGTRVATAASQAPPTWRDKLRAEWRTIKRSFASASDDFTAAVRELGRKGTGE